MASTRSTADRAARPERLLRLAEAALWVGLGLAAAALLWALATPAGPLGDWRPAAPRAAAPPAVDRAILGQFDAFFRSTAQTSGPVAASTLNLVLTGTRLDRASGRGAAIIATPDGQEASVLVGEEVIPGVRLVEVAFDSVTLERAGQREQLFLDQSAPAPDGAALAGLPPAGAPAPVPPPPGVRGGAILADGVAAAGASAVVENGQTVGVRIQRPPAALVAAGLRPGEVVRAIDGQPLTSPAQLARLAQSQPGRQVTMSVERDGETVTLTVEDPR